MNLYNYILWGREYIFYSKRVKNLNYKIVTFSQNAKSAIIYTFLLLFSFYKFKNKIFLCNKMADLADLKSNYKIYNVENYALADVKFIQTNYVELSKTKLKNLLLKSKKKYHFRIHPATHYVFFGDIDNFELEISEYIKLLQEFMKTFYALEFIVDDFKYTRNDKKLNSYHFSIPKWNAITDKLKEIFTNFQKFLKARDVNLGKAVDTTIYSEHWFRCPNQYKGSGEMNDTHQIIVGDMTDFIVEYIPKKSININSVIYLEPIPVTTQKKTHQLKKTKLINNIRNNSLTKSIQNEIEEIDITLQTQNQLEKFENINKENVLSNILSKPMTCKKVFDDCYKKERFDEYQCWITVGMALKNSFADEDAINLFDYFSSKGQKYEGYEKTKYKFLSFVRQNDNDGFTIATIYYYAMEDNKTKFIEIMNKNTLELGQTDMCRFLQLIAGNRFVYKIIGGIYVLYCYNGKYWQRDDVIFKKVVSNELHDFLKTILINVYWNTREFPQIKAKLDKLKSIEYKDKLLKTYKEYGVNNDIKFDSKWYLLGFNNLVYDLEASEMRDYKYEDYVSITTGYDWREPTDDELQTMTRLIELVMPIETEREAYLQILSTALSGKCLEKFIIFNGSGGNGKGMLDDILLLALGEYAMIGNNGILFETSKTGSNPEKANLHKKRLVIFREPPEKNRFENSIIKELTGGGSFSARGLYEGICEKELNLTLIVECNKRPLFKEEPTEADARRIIDVLFRSSFVSDGRLLDETNYIYKANTLFKTKEFQEQHKFALIKILMDTYKKYKHMSGELILPASVIERGTRYLELSCNIVQWFRDNYEETGNTEFVCVKDAYDLFIGSDFMNSLSRQERAKYTKKYFVEYIQNNIFFRKYYADRYNAIRTVIKGWRLKTNTE